MRDGVRAEREREPHAQCGPSALRRRPCSQASDACTRDRERGSLATCACVHGGREVSGGRRQHQEPE
eukprot:4478771-Pyramimonas_sp.AAC.1